MLRHLESGHAEWAPTPTCARFRALWCSAARWSPATWPWAHTQPLLNDAAERMTATLALALALFPHLRILFTGVTATCSAQGPSEAQRARQFFADQGLDLQRLQFEDASRTTWENAKLGARVVGPMSKNAGCW